MSNPGVITLASLRSAGPNIRRLDIEDNIGEAIHIHWNSLRLDMTVREFLDLSRQLELCDEALSALMTVPRSSFDPYFLFRMGRLAAYMSRVEVQRVKLSELKCLVKVRLPGVGDVMIPRPVHMTPAYRYLKGHSAAFLEYRQDGYPGQTNEVRLRELANSIQRSGYPLDGRYITLFGDQNYVRDGQHRAACLAAQVGLDHPVDVLVVHFSRRGWKLRPYVALARATAEAVMRRFIKGVRRISRTLSEILDVRNGQ